jgi:hypothetical protein
VTIVNEKGEIEENQVIGRDIELFTDMREQETSSMGKTIQTGGDVFPLPFFGVPAGLPHWPSKENNEYKLFRSASTLKVIQYYGIMEKVVKIDNGSSITTENVGYDGLTGQVVISKTQNEFEKPVYTVNFPAYWIYPAMGAAYKNIGTLFQGFRVNPDGTIFNGTYAAIMRGGDELVDLTNGNTYWVIESRANNDVNQPLTKKVVDRNGYIVTSIGSTVKILRSGYRNLLTPSATSITCLSDPISATADRIGKKYVLLAEDLYRSSLKVITAAATEFDDTWGAPPPCPTCPSGYALSADGQNCIALPVENTGYCFSLCNGYISTSYGIDGAKILSPDRATQKVIKSDFFGGACACAPRPTARVAAVTSTDSVKTARIMAIPEAVVPTPGSCGRNAQTNNPCDSNACGRLSKIGIWPCTADWLSNGDEIVIEACFDVKVKKQYYLGFAGDNRITVYIDGKSPSPFTSYPNEEDQNAYRTWHVEPTEELSVGTHTIRIQFKNDGGPASVGVEIYNNAYQQMNESFNESVADIIFSTKNLIGSNAQVIRGYGSSQVPHRYTCPNGAQYSQCFQCGQVPVNTIINPYVAGFKGSWRPSKKNVFQVNRKYNELFNPELAGIDLKNAGHFETFIPYFYYNYNSSQPAWSNTAAKEWITGNSITLYDKYGEELENKDALGRYSAASFVFKGTLPGAVASNAKKREIYYESFEDFRFRSGSASDLGAGCAPVFKINGSDDLSAQITSEYVHSGNYSLSLPGTGLLLNTVVHDLQHKQSDYLNNNSRGEYATFPVRNRYPVGFQPEGNKKYVFSAWVKDNQPTTNTPGITVSVNGANVTLTVKAVVEKWKQVEGIIDLPATANNNALSVKVQPAGGTVYLDDLRIHPFEAHMKTYAYDDKTLRQMAELDENNFATFYEYDEEGSLVRVKKETERGVMTIKENRSSYKRNKTYQP